jgi:hypothetical protein
LRYTNNLSGTKDRAGHRLESFIRATAGRRITYAELTA